MALTVTPSGAAARGIPLAEAGMIARRVTTRYFPEVNDKLPGITGETAVRGVSSVYSREIALEGEVGAGSGGLFGVAIGASFAANSNTVANDITWAGGTDPAVTNKIFLDEVTDTIDRSGWHSISSRMSSNPLL